jgi:hypothetical protein
MQRIYQDYALTSEAQCAVCFRKIFPGMTVFNCELRVDRRGLAHSL